MVSTDLAEVQYLADRVLVMRSGAVSAEFGRGARQAELLAAAAGDDTARRRHGTRRPGRAPTGDGPTRPTAHDTGPAKGRH